MPHLIYDFELLTKSPEVGSILRQPLFIAPKFGVLEQNAYICDDQHTPLPMKRLLTYALSLLAACMVCSCEKADFGDGDDKKKETQTETPGDDGDGDESVEWLEDDIEHIGYDDENFDTGDTVSVTVFRNNVIKTQVWVVGYIVGAATGAGNNCRYEFGPTFSYDTAILLADDPEADDVGQVVAVSLTNSSEEVRGKLNLRDNPDNKGKRMAVFGIQKDYLDIVGIKSIDAYKFPLE